MSFSTSSPWWPQPRVPLCPRVVLDFSPGTAYLHVSVGRNLSWKASAKFTQTTMRCSTLPGINHWITVRVRVVLLNDPDHLVQGGVWVEGGSSTNVLLWPWVCDCPNPHVVCPPDLMPRTPEGSQCENMGDVHPIAQVQSLLTLLPHGTHLAPASGMHCRQILYQLSYEGILISLTGGI